MVENEQKVLPEKFRLWWGLDRKKIKWYPQIDTEKCVGCGLCATGCGRNVYDFDFEIKLPVIARPNQCMVGCSTCSVNCPFDAITFPPKEYVREIIRNEKIILKSRKKLKELHKKEITVSP
ncbi:MAG: hypothetical protein GPJ54_19070 [Candidatus Heimdallarchaeota archaeon]|nr:hypothetical protein [Candidatus Heimdallarchaeota archaeon]